MRSRFLCRIVLGILLICQFPVCFGNEAADANDSSKYLNAVREFADNVLKYGRDTYGLKHTPLFVDGLNIHTHEPVKWIAPNGDRWILSNLASQQNLFRTLDGLSNITGDPKYKQAAMDAIKYAFDNLQSPSGLFYWGGHSAYDAQADKPCGRGTHELKGFYPYYELMWEVNPKTTRQYIEAFWAGHILDWSSLSMNRHYYEMSKPIKRSWDHDYEPAPVFTGSGFSPSSTGGDLYYAGAWLNSFTGEKKPLTWAKRLAYRYVETRHPNTGISARVFTGTGVQSNDEVISKLKPVPYTFPWQGHANRALWQSHFGYDTPSPGTMMNRVSAPWICQLMLGELLGSDGKEFIQWSLEELTAWGKVAYRKEDNTFVPMCYDGTVVEGYVCKEDSPLGLKGSKLEAVPLKITELWAYTLAYCLTEDPFMWEMARNIALANDCGDLGATVDDQPKLNFETTVCDPYAMVVFLELHHRIGKKAFLKMAQRIGDNILDHRLYKGFVSLDGQYTFTKFDAVDPLALLHLHTALIRDKSTNVPKVWPGTSFFEEAYRSKDAVDDNQLIYSLKSLSEPPRSLQEVAAEGNLEAVKTMISQGVDVDRREDGFRKTALHRAVMAGHKDVAKLLIDAGARLDAKTGGSTALHYAAEKGHKEVVELLLASGANVDSIRERSNETPLHIASRNGQKAIVEVLVAAGADVQAKNDSGRTPVNVAAREGHREIRQLLRAKVVETSIHEAASLGALEKVKAFLENGINIDAKDGQGMTPLHLAAREGRREVVELLLSNDANINVQNKAGDTPLHCVTWPGGVGIEIARLLIAKEADVNAKNNDGKTPLDMAVTRNHSEIADLLIEKGATVSTIHTAAFVGNVEKIRSFMKGSIDINIKDDDGQTPLFKAVYGGHIDAVRFLVDNGANVNEKDNRNNISLHNAVWFHRNEIAKLLINRGADIQAIGNFGFTPLHWAGMVDNRELAEILLAKGVDVDAKAEDGRTALDFAVIRGSSAVGQLLVERGAEVSSIHAAALIGDLAKVRFFLNEGVDVSEKKASGVTALHSAAAGGHRRIAELLIDNESDVDAQTRAGQTPLHIAAEAGYLDVVQLLLTHGADVIVKNKRGRMALDLAQEAKHEGVVELLRNHINKENKASESSPK